MGAAGSELEELYLRPGLVTYCNPRKCTSEYGDAGLGGEELWVTTSARLRAAFGSFVADTSRRAYLEKAKAELEKLEQGQRMAALAEYGLALANQTHS